MTLKTTEKQAERIHALIRDSCANCQDGRCLLLGDSCIQLLSLYGIYCKYFLKKKEYWIHKQGKKTHRDCLREDIEYCLSYSSKPEEFESQLHALGYELDRVRFSVKAIGWERSVRLAGIGFSREVVNARFEENRNNFYFYRDEWNTHLPYKPKQFPLEYELRRLGFEIEHTHDTATVLVDTILLLIISVIMIAQEMADVMLLSPELRHAAKDIQSFVEDYHFLQSNNIQTDAELAESIKADQASLTELERQRDKLSNKIRRPKSPQELEENKAQRKELSKQMAPLRKKIKQAERILEQSPHLEELLRHEHELEKRAMNRYRERER